MQYIELNPGGLRPDRRARSFSAKRRWIYNEVAAKVSICGTCAADSLRMSLYAVPVQRICAKSAAGGGANVTICGACAADLCEVGGGGRTSGGLVKHAFSSKVSVLPRRQHHLFENRLGGVPLSDFTVTLHLQCNLTE